MTELQKVFALRDWFLTTKYGMNFYDFQKQISNAIIEHAIRRDGVTIAIEVSRQGGKTEAVVKTVNFLLNYYKDLLDRALALGIFAPQREQAKTDFDRLKTDLKKLDPQGLSSEEKNAQTLRMTDGSEAYIFPVTKTSHPESKTLDLLIFEESQLIDDHEMKNSVWPMGAATNAPHIYIGTAGYQICHFYRLLQKKKCKIFKFPYQEIIEEKRRAYQLDGNADHLKYEQYIEKQKEELGEDSDEFRTQYKLEWVLGTGQFITEEVLYGLRTAEVVEESKEECVVGIDTAKHPDSTVVTVKLLKSKQIANWLELHGDNYQDQFEAICNWLKRYPNISRIALDATGQGDFMPDMFENNTAYNIERVKFSLPKKDVIYKNLITMVRNKSTAYPKDDIPERAKFEAQMMDLQKEYKGDLLSCHHPDEKDGRDDYCDSWALCEYAHKLLLDQGEPGIG